MPKILEKDYPVHYYEMDFKHRLFLTRLMNFCDDIAISQSELLGIGIEVLRNRKVSWVLHQWNLTIEQYPVYMETIRIRTTPQATRKFYAYRKYEIFNQAGNKIAEAETVWLLIDFEKKRPVKIPDDISNAYEMEREGCGAPDMIMPAEPSVSDKKVEFDVRFSDIDTNQHVNNAKYMEWAIETMPQDIILNCRIRNVNICYKKELKFGDSIESIVELKTENDRTRGLHRITDKAGAAVCLLETEWVRDDG
jgi:medium-chain acyl-[acyl-carrier-protein] hydrolase